MCSAFVQSVRLTPHCKHLLILTHPSSCFHFLRPRSIHHLRKLCVFALLRPFFICFLCQHTLAGFGHRPSLITPYSCLSAQALQKFSFDQMIITFFTSSGHVSLKFIFLFSGEMNFHILATSDPRLPAAVWQGFLVLCNLAHLI